jgi:hypothetical protein
MNAFWNFKQGAWLEPQKYQHYSCPELELEFVGNQKCSAYPWCSWWQWYQKNIEGVTDSCTLVGEAKPVQPNSAQALILGPQGFGMQSPIVISLVYQEPLEDSQAGMLCQSGE